MLHVYGFPLSFPSNKVQMCVNALELEHEFHLVALREGEQKSEEFLAINPVGKVPAINDDGFCLGESHAIMKYLARKSNSSLYPTDLQEQAKTDQWLDFIAGHIGTAVSKVLFNTLFAPMKGVDVDENSLAEGRKWLEQYLPHAETALSDQEYLTGDSFSIADISLLAALDPAELIKLDWAPYPKLAKWRDNLIQQNFYKGVHAYFGENFLPN